MSELPADDTWLSAPEAERLQAMLYTKRRQEARLGRFTAKCAVARALHLDEQDQDILRALVIKNAADGAPEVFVDGRRAPVCISMSDRADWAVCTVLGGERPIGCDLELVEPRSRAFVDDYFTPGEQALVGDSLEDHDLLANLIWSAKESALKVLRTGLRLDTRSVDVTVGRESGADEWCALYVTTSDMLTFPGWWRTFGAFVFTYVSARTTGPPTSLTDPSPLTGAIPSHSWMADPRGSS